MSTPLFLANGRIIDPANGLDTRGDILVAEGVIREIRLGAEAGAAPPAGCTVYDCQGKWLVPGLVDMHVHLREPGEEYKETVESGTRAAAAGGFTAVACMPNTKPVNDDQTVTRFLIDRARQASARVYPVGTISKACKGETLAEFGDLKEAGIVAVSDDGWPVMNSQLMRRALEYASNHGLLVISHSEEANLARNGVMNEGAVSTRLGLKGIPRVAEEIMVYRDLALASFTGCPIHIAHISTRETVAIIRRAKEQGWPVTAETAPHYFTLTEEAVDHYNTHAKMNPPLRTADDVAAIIEGLADSTIDAIATDHAPHSSLEKELEFDAAANGIIGLETALPLALALVRQGAFDEKRLVELLSTRPARILGVPGGSLTPGQAADLTVIDPEKRFVYTRDRVVSKSRNSPFLDMHLQGKAVLTVMGGRITYEDFS